MIVGEHSRDTDLDVRKNLVPLQHALFCIWMTDLFAMVALLQVNPVRTKELTNVRAACKDENVKLSPPRLVCDCQPFKLLCFISSNFVSFFIC